MLLIVLDWFWYCKWIIGSLSAYRTYLWSHLYCCPLLTVDFYRASYASAVLGVVILSVCLSVCHTRALWLIQRTDRQYFTPHETAIILVFWCQRSQRNSNGVTPNGGAKERWGRLKRRFSTNIPGTADRCKRCQLSSPMSVINFWWSAAMLITSAIEKSIQQLGWVEEMVYTGTARCSYGSAVLGVVILFVRPSVRHTCALWLIQRTYRRYFYTTQKGNPSSQLWFFIQLCSSDKISTDLRRRTVPLP